MSYIDITTKDSVAILTLDKPGEKVNTLDESLIEQFSEFLDDFENDQELIGAVLISGKDDNFIAGADIDMFKERDTAEQLEQLSRTGHEILDRIAQSKKPVVVAIHGSCMGGGLELSLACHYRMASDHKKTVLALPEVKLGVIPGTGGTQRLPRLVGLQKSLGYMLTGKNIYPRQAKKIGLVDELIHKDALEAAAIKAVHKLHDGTMPERQDKRAIHEKLLEATGIGRSVIFSQARKKTKGQTKGNYPAPLLLLDAVEYGYKNGLEKGLKKESELFGKAGATSESRALVHLFFGMNDAKKNTQKDKARSVSTIGVLGAGLMGAGIADVSINKAGYSVLLKDQDMESASKGARGIWKDLDQKREKRIISSFERDQLFSQVVPTDNYENFHTADIVIEAVFEDLDLKRRIVKEVEEATGNHCIFASNTSSLPISDIAKGAKRPENIVGMHYFSPVQKMPLMELIVTPDTADWVTATAFEAGVQQGKHVIVVNDGPGFYTTRILAPYMNESLILLEEGAEIGWLDSIMKKFGYPVGPMALLDEVGIDVGAHVGETMSALFDDRGGRSSTKAQELMDDGYLGKKNKKGMYDYSGDKKKPNTAIYSYFGGSQRKNPDAETAQLRMALMMVNEAVYCLQEDILKSPTDGDLGAILGLGFPPFTGGPFRYIDHKGARWVADKLKEFEESYGPRFTPAPMLVEYADGGKKFHEVR